MQAKAQTISSAANPLLKDLRRAVQRGSVTKQGWCIAEGFHLLEEALRSDLRIMAVLAAESMRFMVEARMRDVAGSKFMVLPDELFQSIASTGTTQGVMALIDPPVWPLERLFGTRPLVVVLDSLQDPGNAGSIVRVAEAFGASGAVFLKGAVSPFNPKVLRASAGSLFRLPFLHGIDPDSIRDTFEQRSIQLYAAVPTRPGTLARPLSSVDLTTPCGIIIGNEAHGVGETLQLAASGITIPTARVESLNAAVAAGVLLYEARRQRAQRR